MLWHPLAEGKVKILGGFDGFLCFLNRSLVSEIAEVAMELHWMLLKIPKNLQRSGSFNTSFQ